LKEAHEVIAQYSIDCRMPAHAAPRTTCIACVVQDGLACWAHAGDSRLYLIRGQTARPTGSGGEQTFSHTRDHSAVQRLLDEGKISPDELAQHPQRHLVFSCLGGDAEPHIEVSRGAPLSAGDVIALCTDGAWSLLHEDLAKKLTNLPLDTAVPQLIASAAASGGRNADNLTMIAMRWEMPELNPVNTMNSVDEVTIPMPRADQAAAPMLSDAEIASTIAEIRSRLSPQKKL